MSTEPSRITESVVKEAALDWLGGLGYEVLSGLAIAPGEPVAERSDYEQVFLFDRLQTRLEDLNPNIPLEGLQELSMNPRVTEFQCIMPLENIPSVLKLGILSNERAAKVPHYSVALEVVQERRDLKHVPGGLKLHQYANLISTPAIRCSSNARIRRRHCASCAFQRKCGILNGVVFADRNASSDYVRFLHPRQEGVLDYDAIFAMDWRHPNDPIAYYRHRSQKCAEVLVPHCVEPQFLTGAYAVDQAVAANLQSQGFGLPITVNPELFFR